jgi:hypothetical protein
MSRSSLILLIGILLIIFGYVSFRNLRYFENTTSGDSIYEIKSYGEPSGISQLRMKSSISTEMSGTPIVEVAVKDNIPDSNITQKEDVDSEKIQKIVKLALRENSYKWLLKTIPETFPKSEEDILYRQNQKYSPIPYHYQCLRNFSKFHVEIPNYDDAVSNRKKLPNMRKQKARGERDNLKIHVCNAIYEPYSSAYLTTTRHILSRPANHYNLSIVDGEMATFYYVSETNRVYTDFNISGIIIQTLDVFDFSVIHLSAFERSLRKYQSQRKKVGKTAIEEVVTVANILKDLNDVEHGNRKRNIQYSSSAKETIVVMPFLGNQMGSGHSNLENRFVYLYATFWSLKEFFPYIAIMVANIADYNWLKTESKLPFYHIELITGLPRVNALPFATISVTREMILSQQWSHFRFVYFTDSDQIIISRELELLYAHLEQYSGLVRQIT